MSPKVYRAAQVVAVGTTQFAYPVENTHALLLVSMSLEQYKYFASSVAPTVG